MNPVKIRSVDVWSPKLAWEDRKDGTTCVWRKDGLGPYPRHMSERLLHWADLYPDRTWMAERGPDAEWIRVSYSELVKQMRSVAQALLNLGLSPERPVLVLSGNSLKHGILVLAAQHVGIPTAAISTAYSTGKGGFEKLKGILEQISPGFVFAAEIAPFQSALTGAVPEDVVIGSAIGMAQSHPTISWDELVTTRATADVDRAHASTGPDTIAKFLFTSGTTGSPKAVVQTQRMLCANQQQILDCFSFMKTEPPILVDWAPWNHTASGNKVFNMALYNGGTYYIDAGKPTAAGMAETIRNLREISPTWYFNVPAGYEMLVEAMQNDAKLRATFFHSVNMLMYAGAGLAAHLWEQLKEVAVRTVGEEILLTTGLGSTETGPFSLYCTDPQDAPGNVGIPAQGVTMKLVPTAGKLEVRIKGPNITPGYWRDAKTTAAAFDSEGFYRMGDALRYAVPGDPTQGFHFDGRIAENFKLSTGTWVAVGNVRANLNDALGGFVRDVVIAGEGKNALGALLIPFRPAVERLVPGGQDLSDADLFARPEFLAELTTQLNAYAGSVSGSSRCVAQIIVLDRPLSLAEGELTDKGSVNQRAVLRNHADLVAKLYSDDPDVIVTKSKKPH